MILDTFAILAILLREPDAATFATATGQAGSLHMSVASCLELAIYVDRHRDEVRRAMLDTFTDEFAIRLEPDMAGCRFQTRTRGGATLAWSAAVKVRAAGMVYRPN